MTSIHSLKKISPSYDPWEAYEDIEEYGKMTLTNIEFTTTTLCNMRCEHCAVGYTLQTKDLKEFIVDYVLLTQDLINNSNDLQSLVDESIH